MITITETELFDLMYDIGVDSAEDDDGYGNVPTVRTDYSGRGMYGDRCVGIVCDNPARIMFDLGMALGERIANEEGVRWYEIAQAFKHARTDSMGLSSIVYFESLSFDNEAATC